MQHVPHFRQRRRGAVAPLAAVLITLFLGMVAFAVDIGWIALAEADLQTAADAAALAGADPLMDGYVQYQLARLEEAKKLVRATALAAARTRAKEFAAHNRAGGVANLVLLDSDIEFGTMDGKGNYSALGASSDFPNTIKVTLRRSAAANGTLKLFFAPVLGTSTTDLDVTASATIYGGKVDSFEPLPKRNVAILPVTYDVNDWKYFVANGTLEGVQVEVAGSNSLPQLTIYPSIKDKGNFGELSLEDSRAADGTSTIADWVNNGVPTSDLETLVANGLLPLSNHNPSLWDWSGNPGFRAKVVSEVNDNTTKVYVLPLFKPYSTGPTGYQAGVGSGSHYDFNIVEFVGVKVMPVSDTNKQITVQPAAYVDPFVTFSSGGAAPAGSTGTLITTFTTPKLSR